MILTVQLSSEQSSSSRRSNFGDKLHIWDKERIKYRPIFFFTWQILDAFKKLELEDHVENSSQQAVAVCIWNLFIPAGVSCGHANLSNFSTTEAGLAIQHEKLDYRQILKHSFF